MKRLKKVSVNFVPVFPTKPKSNFEKGVFFEACGPILAIAQLFGAMPVRGVTQKNPDQLDFTWKSFRFWYSILCIMSQVWFFICVAIAKTGFSLSRITLLVVYGSVTYIMTFMLYIAKQWPDAMAKWTNLEHSLPTTTEDGMKKHQMAIHIRKVFVIVCVMSVVEHLLGVLATLTVVCIEGPDHDEIKGFFLAHLPLFFKAVTYTPFTAFLGKMANIINTFMWFYVDLFVILIAIGLSNTFRLYCDYLCKFSGKCTSNVFWDDQRNFYRQIVELVEQIDRIISPITIVSFSNNLYFICLQLMNTLNERQSPLHSMYFWYTLLYLIARTMAVCLYSADINEESKRPLKVIRAVPLQSWCSELKRFSEDVSDTTAALSGMRFFYLTRKLLLSIAGTILTYELVIIQFYESGSATGGTECNNKTMINFKVGT